MQETDFVFEIIINDDASTDGTKQIIKKYEQDNPGMFRTIYRTENQFSKGSAKFIDDTFKIARGKYIALCEGDDYWTDPKKIQTQVNFLESHPDYALCFHPAKVIFEDGSEDSRIFPDPAKKLNFTTEELLKENYIQTNTVVYKKHKYKKIPDHLMPRDWYLHLYHAQFGKIGFLNKTMSVYRKHTGGVWNNSQVNRLAFWEKYGEGHLILCKELLQIFASKNNFKKIIRTRAANFINDIAQSSKGEETSLLERIVKGYPEFSASTILHNVHVEKSQREENNKLRGTIKEKNAQIDELNRKIADKNAQIAEIKSSRVWKTRNKVAKAVGKKTI